MLEVAAAGDGGLVDRAHRWVRRLAPLMVRHSETSPQLPLCAAQTLGVTVQLTKMVLFAQLAAALSTDSGSKPLGQVIPLLVLTLAYWAYLRIFVPLASFVDMFGEVRLVGGCMRCCATLCCGVAVCLQVLWFVHGNRMQVQLRLQLCPGRTPVPPLEFATSPSLHPILMRAAGGQLRLRPGHLCVRPAGGGAARQQPAPHVSWGGSVELNWLCNGVDQPADSWSIASPPLLSSTHLSPTCPLPLWRSISFLLCPCHAATSWASPCSCSSCLACCALWYRGQSRWWPPAPSGSGAAGSPHPPTDSRRWCGRSWHRWAAWWQGVACYWLKHGGLRLAVAT